MIVAFLLGWVFRLKRSQRSFAVAAAMFMNSNSLPIALMQSLVITVPGLKWGSDDNEDAMVGRALTYLVLYSTLGMIVSLFGVVVRFVIHAVLDPETTDSGEPLPAGALVDSGETGFPPSSEEYRILNHDHSDQSLTVAHAEEYPSISVEDSEQEGSDPKFFYSFPNSPYIKPQDSAPGASTSVRSVPSTAEDDEVDDALEFPGRRSRTEPTSSRWQSRIRRLRRRIGKVLHGLYEFMTVPLWAALLSLIVACIRPLQHALEEHVQPIKGAITQAGNCSIPITLVVLGAYFYSPPDPEEKRSRAALPTHESDARRGRSISTSWSQLSLVDNVREMFKMRRRSPGGAKGKSKSTRPGEIKTVIIAIMARMIITPLLLLPVLALSTRFNLQKVFDDPVFVVSNVLLIASPPALTLAQVSTLLSRPEFTITQAASGDAFERLISRTIFWSYCIVTPPSTIIFVVVGLILSKL
ncbi:hypothetical protein EIP86_008544 [Pleurotus ostreatoroseus]|nr:hypothetical protein EIP86_008544 [Pleurotus ostreatoroseus]